VGLKDSAGNPIAYGHYFLGGKVGQHALFPLANELTQRIVVTPGAQGHVSLACELNTKLVSLNAGYQLFCAQQEKMGALSWNDNTIAIAQANFDTSDTQPTFALTRTAPEFSMSSNGAIQKENLDLATLTAPSQLTHTFFASVGGNGLISTYPLSLSIGGSYQIPSHNAAFRTYGIWSKVGLLF